MKIITLDRHRKTAMTRAPAGERAIIRNADFAADTPALRALIEEYVAWLDFDLAYQNFDTEIAQLDVVYGTPKGFMLVAVSDGRLVGCAGMKRLDSVTGEMKRLYVKPDFQRRRCGMDLIEAVIAHARAAGVERLILDAAPQTVAAQRLYLQADFREIAPYYDSPVQGTRYFEKLLGAGTCAP